MGCLLGRGVLATAALLPVPVGPHPAPPLPASVPDALAAQDTEAPERPPDLQPIPEGEILHRAEITSTALGRIEALIQEQSGIAQVLAGLDEREEAMEALRAELDAIEPALVGERQLENLRFPWLGIASELAAWKRVAEARFDSLQDERELLREVRAQWELTWTKADDQELTGDLRARVESTLQRVIELEARVRERRNEVGSVVERVARGQELVSEALETLDAATLQIREQLLVRDSPPVWRSLAWPEDRTLGIDPAAALNNWSRGLLAFLRLHQLRLVLVASAFVAALWAALVFRRRGHRLADGHPARALLSRPISAALAVSLVVSQLLFPYAIGSAADLTFVLVTIPVLRLGSLALTGTVRRALYEVVALAFLTRLAALIPGGSPGARLLLLAIAGFALARVLSRARHGDRGELPEARHWIVSALLFLTALSLAVALGANLLGWVQVSRLLIESTLTSLFSAFSWLVTVTVAAQLLPAVMCGQLGSWMSGLHRSGEAVARATIRTIAVVAAFLWLRGVLVRAGLDGPILTVIASVTEYELSIGSLSIAVGGILGAILVLMVIWLLSRLVTFLLREQVVPYLRLRRGSGESLVTLTTYTIWAIGIAMAASSAGLTATQLAVVVGALGVGIGFGLQTIVNNFVSGLILIFERPIKVGDVLQLREAWGRVESIGIRASVIRSFDGAEIVVPNGDLVSREVVNWTGSDEFRRVEVTVGVAYGSDPERVLEILLRVAREHPLARSQPEPKAQMVRFGESSLDFRLRCWTRIDDWIDLLSDLHVAINRELRAAGITIPFPQRDLHIKPAGEGARPPAPSPREPS